MGTACYRAVLDPGGGRPVRALAHAYRAEARRSPNLYRLVTRSDFPRADLVEGLEDWAGTPFWLAAGEPATAQALWAYAHGMVILEIDGRFLADSDLDRTWARGVAAFEALR